MSVRNSTDNPAAPAPQPDHLTDEQLEAIAAVGKGTIDMALTCQRASLFQVLGIVRMAAQTIREPGYKHAETDVWVALDGAAELLAPILDRLESTKTLVAKEVHRGEY